MSTDCQTVEFLWKLFREVIRCIIRLGLVVVHDQKLGETHWWVKGLRYNTIKIMKIIRTTHKCVGRIHYVRSIDRELDETTRRRQRQLFINSLEYMWRQSCGKSLPGCRFRKSDTDFIEGSPGWSKCRYSTSIQARSIHIMCFINMDVFDSLGKLL